MLIWYSTKALYIYEVLLLPSRVLSDVCGPCAMTLCCPRTLFFWTSGRRSCRGGLTCETTESAATLLPLPPPPPLRGPPLPSPPGSSPCNRTSWLACVRCSWSRRGATSDRTCRFGLLGTTLRDSTLSRRLVRDQLTRRRRRRQRQ